MRIVTSIWMVGLGVGLSALGCGSKPAADMPPPATAPTPAAAAPPTAAQPAANPAAAPSSIEEASFALRLSEAGPYKAGELGRVVVSIEPRGKFHINQDYPVEVNVSASKDTQFPKATLMRPDAAEFGEKKARFEVPFTTNAAGDHKLLANVKFAVCTDENCIPDERNLALALAVK